MQHFLQTIYFLPKHVHYDCLFAIFKIVFPFILYPDSLLITAAGRNMEYFLKTIYSLIKHMHYDCLLSTSSLFSTSKILSSFFLYPDDLFPPPIAAGTDLTWDTSCKPLYFFPKHKHYDCLFTSSKILTPFFLCSRHLLPPPITAGADLTCSPSSEPFYSLAELLTSSSFRRKLGRALAPEHPLLFKSAHVHTCLARLFRPSLECSNSTSINLGLPCRKSC